MLFVRRAFHRGIEEIFRNLLGLFVILALGCFLGCAVKLSSVERPLNHQPVKRRATDADISGGYRFVVFGDQKNLWEKNFDDMLRRIDATGRDKDKLPLLFMMDSGDIVDNGGEGHLFEELRTHLSLVDSLPYRVGIGNHETMPKETYSDSARANTARFLGFANPDTLYYSEMIGPARFIFLNTNEFPGIYPELFVNDPRAKYRSEAQLRWLQTQLETEVHPTIVISHHAIFQSANKHLPHAKTLWSQKHAAPGGQDGVGKTLPEALNDGKVDLVVTGHVHSYEIFALERNSWTLWTLNASGVPTGLGSGSRMPKNWQTNEGKKHGMCQAF